SLAVEIWRRGRDHVTGPRFETHARSFHRRRKPVSPLLRRRMGDRLVWRTGARADRHDTRGAGQRLFFSSPLSSALRIYVGADDQAEPFYPGGGADQSADPLAQLRQAAGRGEHGGGEEK